MDNLQIYTEKAIEHLMDYGPRLILAIVTLIIGLWIIRVFVKSLKKAMVRSNIEISLHRFLSSLVGVLLKVLLIISVASMIGIQMTSFVAIIGAAGLAVGLALQGSLANFAGGVLILLFKPYKVGDFIEAQGYSGTVKAIQVFNTILNTPDNKTIILPNGGISNSNITNFSTEPLRRVDMTFGISYSDDLKKAKEIIEVMLKSDNRVLDEPAPLVVVSELANSSVNFTARAWCKKEDYWGIYFEMQELIKLEFDKQGISIPFPQQDVHLYKH